MDPKLTAILRDYELALEDLTFNSKPLINNLTMAADKYKPIASKIIEKIEKRLFQVCPEHKMPLLYLLDSIMKNLRGEYVTAISKNVVAVFCHVFEKLTDPKSRMSLWKLRMTWSTHIPNRKLAAIDRHVKALDSNWPVVAVDNDLPSPTIFVNPKFLEPEGKQSAKKEGSPSSEVEKADRQTKDGKPASVNTNSSEKAPKSPPTVTTKPPPTQGAGSEGLTLQDRRKQLLEQQKQKKLKQQISMGLVSSNSTASANASESVVQDPRHLLTTPPLTGIGRRSVSPKPGERRSKSPIPVPSSRSNSKKTSPRNKSPVTVNATVTADVGSNHVGGVEQMATANKHELKPSDQPLSQEETPPVEKRPRVESGESAAGEEKDHTPPKPIKQSTLELDDLPAELLPKHQEYVLKQIERQLQSGSLTEKERDILVEQLDKLYELQRQKEAQKKDSGSSEVQETPTDSNSAVPSHQTPVHSSGPTTGGQPSVSSKPSRDRNPSTIDSAVHTHGPPGPPRPQHPPQPGPPHDRFRRGGPRPHFRPRGPRRPGPRFYPRPPRHHPPQLPPPHWEPMEVDHGPHHQSQPPHPPQPELPPQPPGPPQPPAAPQPPSQIPTDKLFEKLLEVGLVMEGSGGGGQTEQEARPQRQPEASEFVSGPSEKPPLNIPNLSFTPATLKQHYTSLLSLLHAGEPCTSCGLRFISRVGEEYRNHLDWHFRMNRKEREGLRKSSRNWFMHPEDWLKYEESSGMEDKEPPTIVPEVESPEQGQTQENESFSCKVLPGEGNEECTICQEPFEQFWEEDLEEWHFKEALRSDDGKLYHKFCYEDAKASGVLDTSGSQQPSPVVELKPVTAAVS